MYTPSAPPCYEDLSKIPIDARFNQSIDMPIQTQPQFQPTNQTQDFNQFSTSSIQHPIAVINTISDYGYPRLCTGCQLPLKTRVGYRATCKTHLTFLVCCIFCCFICAPFVYCVDSCREPQAYCKACGRMVLV